MGTISVTDIPDGTTAEAADVNANVNTIANEINGELDNANVASDAGIAQSKLSINNWSDYTPTFINFDEGSATISSRYSQIGKTVTWRVRVVVAGDSVVSGALRISLPVTSASSYNGLDNLGIGQAVESGGSRYPLIARWQSTTELSLQELAENGTNVTQTNTGASSPFTWGNNDSFSFIVTYEAA